MCIERCEKHKKIQFFSLIPKPSLRSFCWTAFFHFYIYFFSFSFIISIAKKSTPTAHNLKKGRKKIIIPSFFHLFFSKSSFFWNCCDIFFCLQFSLPMGACNGTFLWSFDLGIFVCSLDFLFACFLVFRQMFFIWKNIFSTQWLAPRALKPFSSSSLFYLPLFSVFH